MARRRGNWSGQLVNRSPDGVEFYSYPSELARGYFYHVLSMGRAKIGANYRCQPLPRAGFLLHYTQRGAVWHVRRGQKWDAGPGTVSLQDLGEGCEHGNKGPGEAHLWWAHIDGRDLPHLFTELRADENPHFDLLDTGRFETLFLELLNLTRTRPAAYEAKAFGTLVGLLAELFAARIKREPMVGLVGRKTVLSAPVRRGIDYMTRFHGNEDLNLHQICHAASLSERHFARLFREEVGITPVQYLTRYRVEHAKRLLASSDKTIEEVARLVGTSNPNYFSYMFRRVTGDSPRAFRSASHDPAGNSRLSS